MQSNRLERYAMQATGNVQAYFVNERSISSIFLAWLCIVLLGYALLGRGFAYLGFAPVYIGEITAAFGLVAFLAAGTRRALLRMPSMYLLAAFMIWGAACTVPYLPVYGIDALRDAALWGYGLFAIVTAGILIKHPWLFRKLLSRYRRFILIFVGLAWLALILKSYPELFPTTPGSTVPLIFPKSGDVGVHIAGSAAFLLLGMARPHVVIVILLALTPFLGNRAGLLAFTLALLATCLLAPVKRRAARAMYCCGCALIVVILTMPSVSIGEKDISAELLWEKAQSMLGESDVSRYNNTRQWRIEWWEKIVNYTVGGPYFWTGKGYGVNLSEDDGFISGAGSALRSPHNGHMTVLARSGVPGFVLWAVLQASWVIVMLTRYVRSRRQGLLAWSSIFAFLIVYWLAMTVNASFDVVLESPMGGIWFWTLFGVGLAAAHLFSTNPGIVQR